MLSAVFLLVVAFAFGPSLIIKHPLNFPNSSHSELPFGAHLLFFHIFTCNILLFLFSAELQSDSSDISHLGGLLCATAG